MCFRLDGITKWFVPYAVRLNISVHVILMQLRHKVGRFCVPVSGSSQRLPCNCCMKFNDTECFLKLTLSITLCIVYTTFRNAKKIYTKNEDSLKKKKAEALSSYCLTMLLRLLITSRTLNIELGSVTISSHGHISVLRI